MDGLFAPPSVITGLLGEQEAERLRKQSIGTGLVGALIGGLTAAPLYRTQGIAPILGQALSAGFQGSQNVYSNALENYMTQQRIAEMQRQQEQRKAREEAIAGLPENLRTIAMLDPNSLGQILVAQQKPQDSLFGKVDPKDYTPESIKKFEESKKFSDLVPIAKPETRSVLGATDIVTARALFGPNISPDVSNWDPKMAQLWERYKNAPNEGERARLGMQAKELYYNTGQSGEIPAARGSFFPSSFPQPSTTETPSVLFGNAPQQPAVTPSTVTPSATSVTKMAANVPPAPVQPRQAQPKPAEQPRKLSVFEQSTPKVRQELLLQRPQVAQSLANMNFKFDSIISQTDALLKNTKGLKAVTGLSSKLPNIRGEARDAQATLEYLKSRAATEALQAMRDASKTGGAIGQVTEREWPRLESAFGSLAESQTYEQFNANLRNLKRAMQEFQKNVRSSFVDTYGTDEQAGKEPMTPASQGQINWMPGAKDAFEKYR